MMNEVMYVTLTYLKEGLPGCQTEFPCLCQYMEAALPVQPESLRGSGDDSITFRYWRALPLIGIRESV